jgi:hypothetical protein
MIINSRTQFFPAERHARSCLVQHLTQKPLLKGTLVRMARTQVGEQRKMIYIPKELEDQVRARLAASRELSRHWKTIAQAGVQHLLAEKQALTKRRKAASQSKKTKRQQSKKRPLNLSGANSTSLP